jgi:FkbM family methyltransferase
MTTDGLKTLIRASVPRSLRNWLRSPSKSMEWIWDWGRYSLGITRSLQVQSDWSVVCHPRAYRTGLKAQIGDPDQAAEFQSFLSHCNSGMILFDLGAHFGLFSLAAAHHGGRSIAVDPSPAAIRMIETQAKLNCHADSINAIRAAVSDSCREIEMLAAGVLSDDYFIISQGRSSRELTRLSATTIDRIAGEFGAPSHIKIDVEGHEAAVLRGGRTTLSLSSPVLFVELHNEIVSMSGGNPNEAIDELDQMGYVVFGVDGQRISREMISKKAIIRVVAKRDQMPRLKSRSSE